MHRRLRSSLSPAAMLAGVALFVALGGTSVADDAVSSAARVLTGKQVKNSSLTGADIKNSTITGRDVKNASLTGGDVKDGSIAKRDLAADALVPGPKGDKGEKGDTGSPGPLVDALPSGKTLRGTFGGGNTATAAGQLAEVSISFPFRLATAPIVHIVQPGATPPSQCPGTVAAPEAQPGHLCAYVRFVNGGGTVTFYGSDNQANPKLGLVLYKTSSGAGTNEFAGSWAVTAS